MVRSQRGCALNAAPAVSGAALGSTMALHRGPGGGGWWVVAWWHVHSPQSTGNREGSLLSFKRMSQKCKMVMSLHGGGEPREERSVVRDAPNSGHWLRFSRWITAPIAPGIPPLPSGDIFLSSGRILSPRDRLSPHTPPSRTHATAATHHHEWLRRENGAPGIHSGHLGA